MRYRPRSGTPSSGVADLGDGVYVLLGTYAPCECGSTACRAPYRMTQRDDEGRAAALVRVLDTVGRPVASFATRLDAVDRYGRRTDTPPERWT